MAQLDPCRAAPCAVRPFLAVATPAVPLPAAALSFHLGSSLVHTPTPRRAVARDPSAAGEVQRRLLADRQRDAVVFLHPSVRGSPPAPPPCPRSHGRQPAGRRRRRAAMTCPLHLALDLPRRAAEPREHLEGERDPVAVGAPNAARPPRPVSRDVQPLWFRTPVRSPVREVDRCPAQSVGGRDAAVDLLDPDVPVRALVTARPPCPRDPAAEDR